jgi:hypothetical protein
MRGRHPPKNEMKRKVMLDDVEGSTSFPPHFEISATPSIKRECNLKYCPDKDVGLLLYA